MTDTQSQPQVDPEVTEVKIEDIPEWQYAQDVLGNWRMRPRTHEGDIYFKMIIPHDRDAVQLRIWYYRSTPMGPERFDLVTRIMGLGKPTELQWVKSGPGYVLNEEVIQFDGLTRWEFFKNIEDSSGDRLMICNAILLTIFGEDQEIVRVD